MKEKNTKEIVEKNKNSKKMRKRVKRQVSIFTVILWIFLITTMITITVNSTKKTNALEVEDENWNIQLVMYDRSSDTPDQAITEFTWNAVNENETKQLCMQINYACTTNKGYQPGELEITIPGIAKDSFSEYWRNLDSTNKYSYEVWLRDNITIAADKSIDTSKKYDWSYSYDSENNVYIFTNNMAIAENEHFEGTIQIVYNLFPRFKIQIDLEYKAKIKENIENAEKIIAKESNICNFNYIGNKKIYNLEKTALAGAKADYTNIDSILNNYYWVRYYFTNNENDGVIKSYGEDNKILDYEESKCIKEVLPEGCILYDKNLNKIEPKENNTYYYLYKTIRNNYHYYYVGYPKDKYSEGEKITNTAELWGRYEDEEEMQKLTEASSVVSLVDFNFDYTGDLYSISKGLGSNTSVYKNQIKSEGKIIEWYISPIAFFTGNSMDVEIGDDLLYITRENGEVTKLNDDEYNFTKIEIPIFYTYNKYSDTSGDKLVGYNYEIQVRYKNTSEYVVYKDGIISDKSQTITFDRNDIVGIKLVIKNLNKTLYTNTLSLEKIRVSTNIHTEDCEVGNIYNFDYLQVYEKDEEENRILVNEPAKDSYKTPSTLKIADYDMSTYGTYMQRGFANEDIQDGNVDLICRKDLLKLENKAKEEKYELIYSLGINCRFEYYNVDKDVIIKQYDILPSGMNLSISKEEIINSIRSSLPYKSLKLKDGTIFNTKEELENYIKENTEVDIDYNYKESGRVKISIVYNLSGIDWSYCLANSITSYICVDIYGEVSYDNLLEYGTTYINYTYAMWNNQEYGYNGNSYSITNDNGKYDSLANDIDNDGDTEEKLKYKSNTLNITHAVSSQQAVIKQSRTDLTKGKFVEETAEATAGSEYTYKLRVTTGANSLKDLIIYDTLETIYDESGNDISSGWKGEFLNVDTSYAVSKGYAPVVYYSEEQNPGKLTEVPDKWKILTEDTDKSTVKSICVDLRYKVDGTEIELSSNNVVFVLINMQAPSDDTIITSANNMFRTNWRAIDPLGTVIDNVEGIYSNQVNVEIHKEDIRTNISGTKIWEDEDNKYGVRPESITVKLLQDGVEYETKTVTESDNWNYTFENIPVYASNTHAYEYEIVEENVENYITEYDGNNITNKVNKTEVKVEKVWDDNENESQKRPESVKVNLLKNSEVIDSVVLNSENEWKHTFTDLQKYDESGNEIVYTVDEEITSEFYIKEIVGGKITNRFVVPEDRIKLVGRKLWEDEENIAGKRPESIVLQVKVGDKVVTEAEVSDKNNWSYEFELSKYDSLGNEIEYYIDEKDSGNKFYEKIESEEKNTVTNKFVVPEEKVEIWVNKVWVDENNKYGKRPSSIILQVKNNGEVVKEAEVSLSDEWRYKFELLKYDELGNEIEYTVDEREINEGDLKYYNKEIKGNEIINTNTYEEVTDTYDINIFVYVVIFFIAIIGVIVGIMFARKNKKSK